VATRKSISVGASDLNAKVSHILLPFYLTWPANWAALETMDMKP
jgi:hypothetical protein